MHFSFSLAFSIFFCFGFCLFLVDIHRSRYRWCFYCSGCELKLFGIMKKKNWKFFFLFWIYCSMWVYYFFLSNFILWFVHAKDIYVENRAFKSTRTIYIYIICIYIYMKKGACARHLRKTLTLAIIDYFLPLCNNYSNILFKKFKTNEF